MDILVIILSLLGASTDKTVDPVTLISKQIIKGVYDEKRVQTVETFIQKYPPDFVD